MRQIFKIILFLLLAASIISCENLHNSKSHQLKLKLLHSYKLKTPEPSGLSFSLDKKNLWVVSDQNSRVYQISLKGKTKHSFKISQKDLEGITVVNDSIIAVISERTNTIILLNNNGQKIKSVKLDLGKKSNSGIEGISYNSNNGHFFVIKEKHKGFLLELDENLIEISRNKLNFAKDYSGLFFNTGNNHLWILSDESRLLAECNMQGKLMKKYKLDIPNPEGLSIDFANKKVYIVSDSAERLYVLKIKTAD